MQTVNSNGLPLISETLFIPLAARAMETAKDNPIIKSITVETFAFRRITLSSIVCEGFNAWV